MLVPDGLLSGRNSICGVSVHSGRSSLYASSARSSLSGRSSSRRRSSSVSIRLPTYNGDAYSDNLGRHSFLLPSPIPPSRLSVSSAWESLRLSVMSLSKVFLVAPCSKHRCCLGCVSLRDAIPLICLMELIITGLLVLIAVDFYVTDGKMFYTNEMEGQGNKVAVGFIIFILFSLPIIGITFAAWHYHKRYLYVIHVLWQWTVMEMILYFNYSILFRMLYPEERKRTGFLFPSAVVLSIVGIVAFLLQCWWLFIFIDAMFFEDVSVDRRMSISSQNSKRQTLPVFKVHQDSEINSISSLESRGHSFAIPIVKVDRTKSLDSESLPNGRRLTLMDEIPEIGHDEAVDI